MKTLQEIQADIDRIEKLINQLGSSINWWRDNIQLGMEEIRKYEAAIEKLEREIDELD